MALGDMFLKIESARKGAIKGESQDSKHRDEIEVLSWSWGMHTHSELTISGHSDRIEMSEVRVVKRVDAATTALMAAANTRDEIKKAVLTMRKAGGTAHEYLRIVMEKARITALEADAGGFGETGQVTENLTLSFQTITIEYVPQGADGQPRGAMSFSGVLYDGGDDSSRGVA
jgi:type VI secretion system secreted protein Hcp